MFSALEMLSKSQPKIIYFEAEFAFPAGGYKFTQMGSGILLQTNLKRPSRANNLHAMRSENIIEARPGEIRARLQGILGRPQVFRGKSSSGVF